MQPRRRDRLRDQLGQLSREECAAGGRVLRLRRPGGNDGRLRQPGAAGGARLGGVRQLLVHALEPARPRRTDRIGGEVGMLGMFLPGWGMHLADIALAQGDLVRAVEQAGLR